MKIHGILPIHELKSCGKIQRQFMILKNLKKTLEIEENFLNLIISFYEKKKPANYT